MRDVRYRAGKTAREAANLSAIEEPQTVDREDFSCEFVAAE